MEENLPVIIDAPGDYLTRAGHRVIIDEIKAVTPGMYDFNCKGTLLIRHQIRNGYKRIFQIWHASGRNVAVGESKRDIVAKINAVHPIL